MPQIRKIGLAWYCGWALSQTREEMGMLRSHRSLGYGHREEVIDDVPSSQADRVEQDFRDAGAISVRRESHWWRDTFRIIGIFADRPARSGDR